MTKTKTKRSVGYNESHRPDVVAVVHIVNDILTEHAKEIGKDKESERTASGISLLVDLAIDFLVRG